MFLIAYRHCNMWCSVVGCAGESDRGKRPIMTKIATDKSDVTILTSDNPKNEDPCKYSSRKCIYTTMESINLQAKLSTIAIFIKILFSSGKEGC